MIFENPLLLGIILIVVGIATALIAGALLLIRREKEANPDNSGNIEPAAAPDALTRQPVPAARSASQTMNLEPAADRESHVKPMIPAPQSDSPIRQPEPAPAPNSQIHPQPGEEPVPQSSKLEPVVFPELQTEQLEPEGQASSSLSSRPSIAEIHRDPLSGRLILMVGERGYSSMDDLCASSDWQIVEPSLAELTEWMGQAKNPKREDYNRGLSIPKPSSAEKKAGRKPTLPAAQPMSMVEQINDIIQQRIRSSGKTHLSVRLIEGLNGEIKALIGVESYLLHDVPEPEVKAFIQECVAEWENRI